jgi:hypothetical protein
MAAADQRRAVMGRSLRAIFKRWSKRANEEPFSPLAVVIVVLLFFFLAVFLIDVVLPAMTRPR